MSEPLDVRISHIGLCTSDIEHSLRFYTEALGFVLDRSIDDIGSPYDSLMELPGVRCRVLSRGLLHRARSTRRHRRDRVCRAPPNEPVGVHPHDLARR